MIIRLILSFALAHCIPPVVQQEQQQPYNQYNQPYNQYNQPYNQYNQYNQPYTQQQHQHHPYYARTLNQNYYYQQASLPQTASKPKFTPLEKNRATDLDFLVSQVLHLSKFITDYRPHDVDHLTQEDKNKALCLINLDPIAAMLLIRWDFNVNAECGNEKTVLIQAAKSGNEQLIDILLASPQINLDKQDAQGNTALHVAVMANQKNIVEKLARNGANVNTRNHQNIAPIFSAEVKNYDEIIAVLLRYDLEINARDPLGRTILHRLVYRSSHDVYLIAACINKKGVNVNAQDNRGNTALIIATQLNKKRTVDMLLNSGASTLVVNFDGETALKVAQINEYKAIKEAILIDKFSRPFHVMLNKMK